MCRSSIFISRSVWVWVLRDITEWHMGYAQPNTSVFWSPVWWCWGKSCYFIRSWSRDSQFVWAEYSQILSFNSFIYRGVIYKVHRGDDNHHGTGDSLIVLGKDVQTSWEPCCIEAIYTIQLKTLSKPVTKVVVCTFDKLDKFDIVQDPYRTYPITGGWLYYSSLKSAVQVVSPSDILWHFALTQNVLPSLTRPHVYVLPLDSVSQCRCYWVHNYWLIAVQDWFNCHSYHHVVLIRSRNGWLLPCNIEAALIVPSLVYIIWLQDLRFIISAKPLPSHTPPVNLSPVAPKNNDSFPHSKRPHIFYLTSCFWQNGTIHDQRKRRWQLLHPQYAPSAYSLQTQFSCHVVSFAWLSSEPTGSVACGLDSSSITVCTFPTNRDDAVSRSFVVLVESAHRLPGGTCMDYLEGPSTPGAVTEFYHRSRIYLCLSIGCMSLELMWWRLGSKSSAWFDDVCQWCLYLPSPSCSFTPITV